MTYPMFWIKYDDLRPYMAQQYILTNNENNVQNYTYDDYFKMRMFEGKIYKTTNLRNMSLMQLYDTAEKQDSARAGIEKQLQNFENSLWVKSPAPVEQASKDMDKKTTTASSGQNATEKEVKSSDTVVKKNQLINFDYEGKVNGKAFDGGTAESQFLRVGSGKMIDGFEDALVGMKVGEKKDAKVTFPKDYRETSLAGKEAVFTLKVNYIYKEATDALVANLDSTYNTKTVKAFKEAAKKELESQNEQQMLSTAMSKITSEAKISKVPDELIKKIKAIQSKSLESQATQSGTDVSTLLGMYGMTEDSYYESIAKERLLAEAVAQAEGYRVTKQDYEDKIAEICKSNNITEADYRKNFKSATSDNASLEDYIVYMMKYEYFYDLVQKTLVKK